MDLSLSPKKSMKVFLSLRRLRSETEVPASSVDARIAGTMYRGYGDHTHTKIAPLVTKITYIKMDPLNPRGRK